MPLSSLAKCSPRNTRNEIWDDVEFKTREKGNLGFSPDFLEPRHVLIAQVMDEARHMDVFRKRALANGGGLMRMSGATSGFVGSIDLARDFTEMSTRLHISGEGAVLTMFRMGELFGQNEAEKVMYRLCAQDEARHVAFGVMHLRFLSETAPERREEIEFYLDEAEAQTLDDAGPAWFRG